MADIRWTNVNQNTDNAVDMLANAYANRAKAFGGLIDVGTAFGKAVQDVNTQNMINEINAKSRMDLANPMAVKEQLINQINDKNNFFGFDDKTISNHLDTRLPVLNAREVDNINTQNSIDTDIVNRATFALMPYKVAVDTAVTDTDKAVAQAEYASVIKGTLPENAYLQGKVVDSLNTQSGEFVKDYVNSSKTFNDFRTAGEVKEVESLAAQASFLQEQFVPNATNEVDVATNRKIAEQILAIEKNPLVMKHRNNFLNIVNERQKDVQNLQMRQDESDAKVYGLITSAEVAKQNADTKQQEVKNTYNIQKENQEIAQDKNALDALDIQQKLASAEQGARAKHATSLGFPAHVYNNDGSINDGVLNEQLNNLIRNSTTVNAERGNSKYKTFSEYYSSKEVKDRINSNDGLTTKPFGIDMTSVIPSADGDRPKKVIDALEKRNIPDNLKIAIMDKIIGGGITFSWDSDENDIEEFINSEQRKAENEDKLSREDSLRKGVVSFFTNTDKLGKPASKVITDLNITPSHPIYPYLTNDLKGIADLNAKKKK